MESRVMNTETHTITYDTYIFPKGGVMVNIFMLVSIHLYHTIITNARDLFYVMGIQLEKLLWVDKVLTGDKSGINRGVNKGITKRLLEITRSNQ